MKKFLFSTWLSNSNPPAPNVGTYEGQNVFDVLNLQPTLSGCASTATNSIPNELNLGYSTSDKSYFCPFQKGICLTPTTSNYGDFTATYILPESSLGKYVVGMRMSQDTPGDVLFNIPNISGGSPVRYIKVTSNGNTYNSGNHVFKVLALDSRLKDVAEKVTNSIVVSGVNNTYITGSEGWEDNGNLIIDLRRLAQIVALLVRRYSLDGRTYHETTTQVSIDGTHWYPVHHYSYDGEYAETSSTGTFSVGDNVIPIGDSIFKIALTQSDNSTTPADSNPNRYIGAILNNKGYHFPGRVSFGSSISAGNYTLPPEDMVFMGQSSDYRTITLGSSSKSRSQSLFSSRHVYYNNMFAYEGDVWYDVPYLPIYSRRYPTIYVCEVEYNDSTHKITSVGPVKKLFDSSNSYPHIRAIQMNVIKMMINDGYSSRGLEVDSSTLDDNVYNEIVETSNLNVTELTNNITEVYNLPTVSRATKVLNSYLSRAYEVSSAIQGGTGCFNSCSASARANEINCAGNCTGVCTDACTRTCGTSCSTTCGSACTTSCVNGCNSNCGGCDSGCSGSCGGYTCTGSCGGTCFGDCSSAGCKGDCTSACWNCTGGCYGACAGCSSACDTRCAGNRTGCWIGCSGSCGNGACDSGCYGGCSPSCGDNCYLSCCTGCQNDCKSNNCGLTCQAACSSTNCGGGCGGNGCSTSCNVNGCGSGCSNTCVTSCSISGCTSSCSSGCSSNCTSTCRSACGNDCGGGCINSCYGGCYTTCDSGCSASSSSLDFR